MKEFSCSAIYGVRFSTRTESFRGEHFYRGDPHADGRMPIDYFMWAIVGTDSTVVLDAGFTKETAEKRGKRPYLQSPIDTLAALGIPLATVHNLIISHLHFDHTGHIASFPNAKVYLQRKEYEFWTGPMALRGEYPHLVEAQDIQLVIDGVASGAVALLDGDAMIVPGVRVHRVGGHTAGLQIVSVESPIGTVVLAADASHFYENIGDDRPYSIVDHLPSMYDAFDRAYALASSPELVIPGHDPKLLERFPAVPGLEGLAIRIV